MFRLPGISVLHALWRRNLLEREMHEELRFHLACQIKDNIKAGMNPREARRAALRDFGGVDQTKEECRESRGFRLFDESRQDLRYALRQLIHNPGFTILAVLVLAFGIGANTAVVSIIDQLIFRPLPVLQPKQLAVIPSSSYLDYIDLRNDNQVFSGAAAVDVFGFDLWDSDHSENLSGKAISANFFDVLGLKMAAGRAFLPEEDQLHGDHSATIISYRLWQRIFGANPAAVGQTMKLNGELLTIVGVAPRRFRDIDYGGAYRDIWIPLPMFKRALHLENEPMYSDLFEQRNKRFLNVIGRLKPGVSLKQAQARMNFVSNQLSKAFADSRRSWGAHADGSLTEDGWTIQLHPLASPRRMNENTIFSINILFVAAGCILLICCANVGSLLLARNSARQREIATRLAVGASRFRVARQLLTESLVLSTISLAASFAVWRATLQCLPALESSLGQGPMDALRDLELVFEPRIFAIAVSIAIFANLIFALAPALLGSRLEITATLREQGFLRGGAGPRWRRILVVAQVMLSFILLIGAGLFIKVLARFETADPGFNTNVLVVHPGAPGYGFNNKKNVGYRQTVIERISALPGVLAASWASDAPPEMGNGGYQMVRTEQSIAANGAYRWIDSNAISPGYFKTLQIPMVQGRDFTDYDDRTASAGTVIINETMARQFWPGLNPLGKRLQVGKSLNDVRKNPEQIYEVVGVVKDAGYSRVWNGPKPYIYFTPAQLGYSEGGASKLHVRIEGNPNSMINQIRKVFESFGPEAKVRGVRPLSAEMRLALSRERSTAFILSCFGGLALLLASVGLYGVISYSVARRSREFGIRLALGAPQSNIMKLVFREGIATVLVGLTLGLPCAIALARLLVNRLHGVSPLDPISYAAISMLWICVAILAVLVPARKAIADPMTALRVE